MCSIRCDKQLSWMFGLILFATLSLMFFQVEVLAQPVVTSPSDVFSEEGIPVVPNAVAFTGTTAPFTATVDWGDGIVQSLGTVTSPITLGSHIYPDDGSFTATVCVTDNASMQGCNTFNGTINNSAPIASPDFLTISERQFSANVNVLFNDLDNGGSFDPLTVDVLLPPTATEGSAVANLDGTVLYTANPALTDTLFFGQKQDVFFVYQVCDDGLDFFGNPSTTGPLCDTNTAIVTVEGDDFLSLSNNSFLVQGSSLQTDVPVGVELPVLPTSIAETLQNDENLRVFTFQLVTDDGQAQTGLSFQANLWHVNLDDNGNIQEDAVGTFAVNPAQSVEFVYNDDIGAYWNDPNANGGLFDVSILTPGDYALRLTMPSGNQLNLIFSV